MCTVCVDAERTWAETAESARVALWTGQKLYPYIAVLGVLAAMWWRLDSKIETRLGRLEALLTDNLIALNRDIGELKGASHTHTRS